MFDELGLGILLDVLLGLGLDTFARKQVEEGCRVEAGCMRQAVDCRLEEAGCRLEAADCRLAAVGCSLELGSWADLDAVASVGLEVEETGRLEETERLDGLVGRDAGEPVVSDGLVVVEAVGLELVVARKVDDPVEVVAPISFGFDSVEAVGLAIDLLNLVLLRCARGFACPWL